MLVCFSLEVEEATVLDMAVCARHKLCRAGTMLECWVRADTCSGVRTRVRPTRVSVWLANICGGPP